MKRQASRLLLVGTVIGALGAVLATGASAQGTITKAEREGTYKYKDLRLPANLLERGWRVYKATENPDNTDSFGRKKDPKYGADYPLRVQVMVYKGDDQLGRVFIVHYQRDADRQLAQRVGCVLGRLYGFGMDYLGLGNDAATSYSDMWLTPTQRPGGEQVEGGGKLEGFTIAGNMYLFGIDEPRAPAEWVREIAHEYSHLIMPAFGTFSAPEKLANGYLGERLFMKWMLADNQQTDLWPEPIDGKAYMEKQILPLRERFLNEGAESPAALKDDAEGMDFFIGEMLALEQEHGPAIFGPLLARPATSRARPASAENQPMDGNLAIMMRDLNGKRLPINPEAFVPNASEVEPPATPDAGFRIKKATYRVFLPSGSWQFSATGTFPAGMTTQLDGMELKPISTVATNVSWETGDMSDSKWRKLTFTVPAGQVLELKSLDLGKR